MLGQMAVDYAKLVLAGGNTPWGGKWFIVNLQHTESRPKPDGDDPGSGSGKPWWEGGLDTAEEEIVEVLYMELDPDRNLAHAKLLTRKEGGEDSPDRGADVEEAAQSGEQSGYATDMYLYEATTNVAPVVEAARGEWSVEPYPIEERELIARREAEFFISAGQMHGRALSPSSPTEAAINATVVNTLYKWGQSPYLSGTHWRVPDEVLIGDETEVAVRLFEVDTGFHGIEP